MMMNEVVEVKEMNAFIYIYIYIERERERGFDAFCIRLVPRLFLRDIFIMYILS